MIGDVFPSEMRVITDEKTGNPVVQLTQKGINFHMYFTDNAFDLGNDRLYFLSNRANEGEIFNIFELNVKTGEMVQMSDEPGGVTIDGFTKTPDSQYIGYVANDNEIKVISTAERKVVSLYKDETKVLHNLSFSADKRRIGFLMDEKADVLPNGGPNYAGFRDKMYAIKEGRIGSISIDGSGFCQVFRDTCWLNHFQFSPTDNRLAMFCHEGPWNEVHQRIWMINMETGDVWPVFRQGPDDCVGHEFWLRNGDIVFDNRRGGHDGTISVTREQVFAQAEAESEEPPYFGFAHSDGRVYKQVMMPFYCNHYMGNGDGTLFVGDGVEDIVLIRPAQDGRGEAEIRTLASHHTTWKYQRSHCHPTFSWDGRKILYAADRDDMHCNLYMVEVPNLQENDTKRKEQLQINSR